MRRHRRHLREMSNRHHLMLFTQACHFPAECTRNFATHIGVNLIKNHQRRGVLLSQGTFDREHHPGNLPARSDLPEWFHRFPGIGPKFKLHILQATRLGFAVPHQTHFEGRLHKTELLEMPCDLLGKLRRCSASLLTELHAQIIGLGARCINFILQLLKVLRAVFHGIQTLGNLIPVL